MSSYLSGTHSIFEDCVNLFNDRDNGIDGRAIRGKSSAWSHWEVIQSRGMDQAIFSASYRIKR